MNGTLIYHEPRFDYDYHNNSGGVCDVKVYKTEDGQVIAIASELVKHDGSYSCDGASVTNAIEFIATRLRTRIGFVPDLWFDYLPARGYRMDEVLARGHKPEYAELFSQIFMKWGDTIEPRKMPGTSYNTATFKAASRKLVEAVIGMPFTHVYVDEDVCQDE